MVSHLPTTLDSFADWLKSQGHSMAGHYKAVNIDIDTHHLIRALEENSFQVVESRSGHYSIVSTDNDRNNPSPLSGCSGFHTDGLYCEQIPELVVLYCVDSGNSNNSTLISDTRVVVDELKRRGLLDIFKQIHMRYDFGRWPAITMPVIENHPITGEPVLRLSMHGVPYLAESAVENIGVRSIQVLMEELYQLLGASVVWRQTWHPNDLLIFDNHTFIHRREHESFDPKRKLIRIWLRAGHQACLLQSANVSETHLKCTSSERITFNLTT